LLEEREARVGSAVDVAAIGLLEAHEQPQDGRLARAVAAYKGKAMTVAKLEGRVVEDDLVAVDLLDSAERSQQHADSSLPARSAPAVPRGGRGALPSSCC